MLKSVKQPCVTGENEHISGFLVVLGFFLCVWVGFFQGWGWGCLLFWIFFDEVEMEMDKDKIEMGEVGSWHYRYIDRTVYLLLAKINPSIHSL